MKDAERTAWFLTGVSTALVGALMWRTHRQVLRAAAAAAGMVGRCRRCKRSYTFAHPSQAKLARHYHDSYDCSKPTEEDVA